MSEIKYRHSEVQDYIDEGNIAEARHMLREICPKADDDKAEHHYLMSQVMFNSREYSDAVRHLKMAIMLQPKNKEYNNYVGCIYAYHTWSTVWSTLTKPLEPVTSPAWQVYTHLMKLLTDKPEPKPSSYRPTARPEKKSNTFVLMLERLAPSYTAIVARFLGKKTQEEHYAPAKGTTS
jgi:tetratricopeptide (TPR) repeat protein